MAENNNLLPNNLTCPRQLFGHDLKTFSEEKTEAEHQLLVCGYFNSEYSDLKE